MRQLPFDIGSILRLSNVREQVLEATRVLHQQTGKGLGAAFRICNDWQSQFEWALRNSIPDWRVMAAFRCIADFNVPLDKINKIFPPKPDPLLPGDFPQRISTYEECWRAYQQYLEDDPPKDLYSGKLKLAEAAETHFLQKLGECEPVLGGQAGNIVWLARCIGMEACAYISYLFEDITRLPDKYPQLKQLDILQFDSGGHYYSHLADLSGQDGVSTNDPLSRIKAPAGGSIVVAKSGRRLIYQFHGMRDLHQNAKDAMAWDCVEFWLGSRLLSTEPICREAENDITWPTLPFFCECTIAVKERKLIVRLARAEEIKATFRGQIDFAVIGGIDALFYDDWLKKDKALQARLQAVVEAQLQALADVGVRIGVEISGVPSPEYARLLQRLCQKGIVVALGINGLDELPTVLNDHKLANEADLWFEPLDLPEPLQTEAKAVKEPGPHFEYLTYLRARTLAEFMGVRTLYAHTTTLDVILRRDADPGALLRAQQGDMMGKGLGLAALLQRAYGSDWLTTPDLDKLPMAINPQAMACLGQFASDFARYEGQAAAEDQLLYSGYWLSSTTSGHPYSLAVVPVMWPPAAENQPAPQLPQKLNTTGGGDMAFGAFFFLGGV